MKKRPFNNSFYDSEVRELQRKYESKVIGEKLKQSSCVIH